MNKPTWSDEEYARWAAEHVLGWPLADMEWHWVKGQGAWTTPPCHDNFVHDFNPSKDWHSAGPVLVKLMGDPWFATSFKGRSKRKDETCFCVENCAYVLDENMKEDTEDKTSVLVGGKTLLLAIEYFCWELKCREDMS